MEKIFLPLCLLVVGSLAFTNPMGFDLQQRISGGLGILCFAYFAAHTIHSYNEKRKTAPTTQSATAQIATTASEQRQERIFVHHEAESLMAIFRDNTEMAAAKLIAPYIGKWIRMSGDVYNTSD